MSRALESISILASDICEDIGDSTERHHLRLMKKLKEGYQQLYWYVLPDLDTIEGEIFPSNGTVQYELPCNFVYATKVGILWRGCFITLDVKKDLRLDNKKYTDTQIEECINGFADGSITPTDWMPFYNLSRCGNWVGEMYAMGCGFHSNQWYNIKDGVLEVGSLIPDDAEIVVEYKSNGIPKLGLKLVPAEAGLAIKSFAKWQFYMDTKPTLSATFEQMYNEQYYRLKRLYSHRPPEYLAFIFKSFDKAGRY